MGWLKSVKKRVTKDVGGVIKPFRFKGKTSTGQIVGTVAGGAAGGAVGGPVGGWVGAYVGGQAGKAIDPPHGGKGGGGQYQTGEASLEGKDTGTGLNEDEETGGRGRISTSTLLTGGMGLLWPAHLRRQQLLAAQRRGLLKRG